jgi:hypothetical protein
VDANASNTSVLDTQNLKHQLHKNYKKLEARLEERTESTNSSKSCEKKNNRYISTTDPDAALVNRGKSKLSYQVHRAVDGKHEIITATDAAPGDVNEAHLMLPLLEKHEETTEIKAETVVADSKYGTIDNFLACHDQGIQAHIPDLRDVAISRIAKTDIFLEDRFSYDSASDTYTCPAGVQLKPKSLHIARQSRDYGAPKKACAACQLREQCTKNKSGRTIKRHLRQDVLERMRINSRSANARYDIKTRQHLMERSFARGTRYGFDKARWRGLWRMRVQEYLTCAIQNIQVLIAHASKPKKAAAAQLLVVQRTEVKAFGSLSLSFPQRQNRYFPIVSLGLFLHQGA